MQYNRRVLDNHKQLEFYNFTRYIDNYKAPLFLVKNFKYFKRTRKD